MAPVDRAGASWARAAPFALILLLPLLLATVVPHELGHWLAYGLVGGDRASARIVLTWGFGAGVPLLHGMCTCDLTFFAPWQKAITLLAGGLVALLVLVAAWWVGVRLATGPRLARRWPGDLGRGLVLAAPLVAAVTAVAEFSPVDPSAGSPLGAQNDGSQLALALGPLPGQVAVGAGLALAAGLLVAGVRRAHAALTTGARAGG